MVSPQVNTARPLDLILSNSDNSLQCPQIFRFTAACQRQTCGLHVHKTSGLEASNNRQRFSPLSSVRKSRTAALVQCRTKIYFWCVHTFGSLQFCKIGTLERMCKRYDIYMVLMAIIRIKFFLLHSVQKFPGMSNCTMQMANTSHRLLATSAQGISIAKHMQQIV